MNLQEFAETILTSLQASTVLFRADQRRAAQKPPPPPITKEQILNSDLKHLLDDSYYDLTAMVIQYSIPITLSLSSANLSHNLFHNLFKLPFTTCFGNINFYTWFNTHLSLHSTKKAKYQCISI